MILDKYKKKLKNKKSYSICNLCEENTVEYKCNLCNYILCRECLRRLINLDCPQCREAIVLTINQNQLIRNTENNNVDIDSEAHNIIVNNSNQSRGLFIVNRNISQYFSSNFYFSFTIIFIAGFMIGSYFTGYYLTGNHKHIIGNFFLGFLFLFTLIFSLLTLYNIISNCLGYNINYSSSSPY